MKVARAKPAIWSAAVVTFGSGVVNLYSVMGQSVPERRGILHQIFPIEFIHASRHAALLVGFALIVTSVNLLKRKRLAFLFAVALSVASIIFHLSKGLDFEEAAISAIVLIVLWFDRRAFTVRSRVPDLRASVVNSVVAIAAVLAYGLVGFWLLEPHHFGANFNVGEAARNTVSVMFFAGDGLDPHTWYARWYLRSLHLATIALLAYISYVLFRPVLYRVTQLPHDVERAAGIRERFGRSALDYYKIWPDKSILLASTGKSFLAYAVALDCAIALADPLGPEEQIETIVQEFTAMCVENDWRPAFHQTLPDFLPIYARAGYKKLKLGDTAIVDLPRFTLEGKVNRILRSKVNQLEKAGVSVRWIEPPVNDALIHEAREVSNEWLQIPGRRERKFTLGWFDDAYLRRTTMFAAFDPSGNMLGFLNVVPSFVPGEASIDLMRRRTETPNGLMDYLVAKLLQELKQRGYSRFDFGMAPMSGFQRSEDPSLQERAVHAFFQRTQRIFSFQGLKNYKAKFATHWEPRYIVYRNALDLPRIALALGKVSAYKEDSDGRTDFDDLKVG